MSQKQLAVLASGRGSNFQAIIEKIATGYMPANMAVLITNNPNAGAIEIAKEHNIPWHVIIPKDFPDSKSFNDEILKRLISAKADYLILAGYLKLIGDQIIDKYENRIINIHPALLPSFGGKGMYGHHVHQAIYDSGVKVSGVTVHLVNKEYDAGPIVLQRCVTIDKAKSPEEIAQRVLKVEHELYSQAIKFMVEDRLIIDGNRVTIKGETDID
jgi:formyltetrahydrofolate-dependent phosphoribosylglycinamide formyltransferase